VLDLKAHPIRADIDRADERYHEVPYTRPLPDGRSDSGAVDLLYHLDELLFISDFKIDQPRDEGVLEEAVEQSRPQIERCAWAAQDLLGANVYARLCFLDYKGEVMLVEI